MGTGPSRLPLPPLPFWLTTSGGQRLADLPELRASVLPPFPSPASPPALVAAFQSMRFCHGNAGPHWSLAAAISFG
eukprot:15216830-Heterocapsa_arctica.AAC.1